MVSAGAPSLVSLVGHQPEYEMFGGADIPFHGDYNGVDSVDGTMFGVWADNRDVIPGDDAGEATQDGFDVLQCRIANPDGSFSASFCPNASRLTWRAAIRPPSTYARRRREGVCPAGVHSDGHVSK